MCVILAVARVPQLAVVYLYLFPSLSPLCLFFTHSTIHSAAGATMGAQKGGIVGGVLGFTGGAVAGALGAAGIAVGGVVQGVVQVGRGVAAVPQQMVAPARGKWWNDQEDRWVFTDMSKEAEGLKSIPADDSDILGGIQSDLDQGKTDGSLTKEVKDTILYDALEVPVDADPSTIKRRYYILARKLHPDKNPGNPEAAEQFKVVSEAYHILSDPEMREKYNRVGRDGLKNDPTELYVYDVAVTTNMLAASFCFSHPPVNQQPQQHTDGRSQGHVCLFVWQRQI